MLIGLTGSIAAGKSTVSRQLRMLGAHVLDADMVAREIVEPGTVGLERLCEAFGEGILGPDGALDRKGLAQIVFHDPAALQTLNQITHPMVVGLMAERSAEWLKTHSSGIVIWDMPLLIECGAWERMDAVWVVTAPEETRLKRLMARDNCTLEHAMARMAAQMPQEEKLRYADVIIENAGDEAALLLQVEANFKAACAGAKGSRI